MRCIAVHPDTFAYRAQVQTALAKFCGFVEVKADESDSDVESSKKEAEDPDEEQLRLQAVYGTPISHLIVALEHESLDVRTAAIESLLGKQSWSNSSALFDMSAPLEYPATILVAQGDEQMQMLRRAILRRFEAETVSTIRASAAAMAAKLIACEIDGRIRWKDARTADGRLQTAQRDTISNR